MLLRADVEKRRYARHTQNLVSPLTTQLTAKFNARLTGKFNLQLAAHNCTLVASGTD